MARQENQPIHLLITLLKSKWTISVLQALQENTLRYSAIEKAIPQITQRALTMTLRNLESNGILDRNAYSSIPPQVEYKLTMTGVDLLKLCKTMDMWAKEHEEDIRRARKAYVRRSR